MVRYFMVTAGCLLLSACLGAGVERTHVKPEELVEEFGGPEVGTMEAALYKGAQEAYASEQYSKAMQLYGQLVSRYPQQLQYLFYFAESARRSGKYDDALKAYEAFIAKKPEHMAAHEGRGITLLALGEVDRAIRVLSTVMKQEASRWRTVNAIGVALSVKNKHDEALKYYRRALKLSPKNASILNNIGLTLALMEDYERAARALDLASKHYGGNDYGHRRIDMNLAMAHALAGNMDRAEKVAGRYLEDAELYNNMGHFAYLAENKEMAQTYLNMALTKSPEYYEKAWENLEDMRKER